MTSTRTTIERKIKGLLAQAADREGTPEGEAFLERALALMAKYGVERAQLADADDSEVVTRTIDLRGSYTVEQAMLLGAIAEALHCKVVSRGFSRRTEKCFVMGVRRHVDRTEMLFSLLNPQMAAGANAAEATRSRLFNTSSPVVAKRSYMLSFAATISERLEAAETAAVDEAGHGAALVVLDDDAKAQQRFEEEFPNIGEPRDFNRQIDEVAAAQGADAANSTDLGQTGIKGQAAIGT